MAKVKGRPARPNWREQREKQRSGLDLVLQPKQEELLRLVEESPATWIDYGGARGGGKSAGARIVQLVRRSRYPGTRGLIFRRTFDQLWENHITPLFQQFPQLKAYYHGGHRELSIPCADGQTSVIVFGYAEHKGDIYTFQGKEYMDICVDQAEALTADEMLFLKTCNRWPGVERTACKMVLFPNPGGPAHKFLKRLFHDREFEGDERPEDYVHLQAYVWDNVEWVRGALAEDGLGAADFYAWDDKKRRDYVIQRSDYGSTLNRLPDALKIGHLYGEWDKFAGQFFDNFDPVRHVVGTPMLGLRDWMPRWIGIDWGFSHASVAYWCAQDGDRTIVYREFAKNQMGPRALAQEIADRSRGEDVRQVYLSPDAFAKRTNEDTIAEQIGKIFRERGLPWPSAADNDRIGGWMLVREMLEYDRVVFAAGCEKLIGSIPLAAHDDDRPEDVLKFDGDDALDAVRYALKSRLAPRAKPEERKLAETMETLPDNQRRSMFHRWWRENSRHERPAFKLGRRARWN